MYNVKVRAKPFLKWAGGKGQLLPAISKYFPRPLLALDRFNYVEPFVGGGAMLFHVLQNYNIETATICDVNKDLIDLYEVVKMQSDELISSLGSLHNAYHSLEEAEDRKTYFYIQRERLNQLKLIELSQLSESQSIEKSALLVFMNKTCFNGLYRVNSKGLFNVPHGRYKNPKILNSINITAASKLLKNVEIVCCDFLETEKYIDKTTLVYFDPPYRPISTTSSFTSYSKGSFNDKDQMRLASYFGKLSNQTGAKLMLSNSDPEDTTPEDQFMNNLYCKYNIHKVRARRSINSVAKKRGTVGEILVTNYEHKIFN